MTFYDKNGSPVAYMDGGGALYLFTGEPVGYVLGDSVYSFTGEHLGWFIDGSIIDHSGYYVFFTEASTGGPAKPARQAMPAKGAKRAKPAKGGRSARPARPAKSPVWSRLSGPGFFR